MAVDCFDSTKMFEIWKTFQQQQKKFANTEQELQNYYNNQTTFEDLFNINEFNKDKKSLNQALISNPIIDQSSLSISPSSSLSSINNNNNNNQWKHQNDSFYLCWKPDDDTSMPLFSSWNNVYNWINSTNTEVKFWLRFVSVLFFSLNLIFYDHFFGKQKCPWN